MIDNSWTKTDRKATSAQSKMMKTKVVLTVAVILIGMIGTIALNGVGSNATQYRSDGIVIDFGDYLTIWTDAGTGSVKDPVGLLETSVTQHASGSFSYVMTDGVLTSITYSGTTYINDGTHSWNLWTIDEGKYDPEKNTDLSIDVSDYTVAIWAYTDAEGEPMPAVDATATSIYGYADPLSVVTLSPVCTETLNSVKGISKLVGTDMYSDYPQTVVDGHSDGSIAVVGSYTDPSYEAIMNTSPDMVFCDASTYNQVQMAGMLRSSDVNAVVLYNGEDIETIYKNVFITGIAIGYNLAAQTYIQKLDYCVQTLHDMAASASGKKVMVALGADPSPWVAGDYTYINDILVQLNCVNAFESVGGWANITAESIAAKNPDIIIVLDSETYTASNYSQMLSNLSDEWKATTAYPDSVYLLCEDMGALAGRAGPRFVQLMEIMCEIVAPDAFSETLPKAVGDDYHDYLTVTGGME